MTYTPSSIEINDLVIVDYSGKRFINIKPITAEFNIYENIFQQQLQADLVITDSLGLIERLPICGDEHVVINFKTPGNPKNNEYCFNISSIQDRKVIKHRTHSYMLQLCTPQTINNYRYSVDKAFTGLSSSQIVQSIYDNYLKPTPSKNVLFKNDEKTYISVSEGLHNFIAPNTDGYSFIQYIMQNSYSADYTSSTWLFYHDSDGVHYHTLEQLAQSEVVEKYYLLEHGVKTIMANNRATSKDEKLEASKSVYDSQKILAIDFEPNCTVSQNYLAGMYGSVLHTIDPFTKRTNVKQYRYDNQFGQTKHIDSIALISSKQQHCTDNSPSQHIIQEQLYEGGNYDQQLGFEKIAGTTLDIHSRFPFTRRKQLLEKRSVFQQFNNISINITINGDNSIRAGNTISLKIPQNSSDNEFINRYNVLYGADNQSDHKFLVTAVRHVYNGLNDDYTTRLNVCKDTYGAPLARESSVLAPQIDPKDWGDTGDWI